MNYEEKKQAEINHYAHIDDPSFESAPTIYDYWRIKWTPIFEAAGFILKPEEDIFIGPIRDKCLAEPDQTVQVISFGTGLCDNEIVVAEGLIAEGIRNFSIECLEFNPEICDRARWNLVDKNLSQYIFVVEQDINEWIPTRPYDIVMAAWCLHHFVALEHIFDQIHNCLFDDGLLVTGEAIGKNGHQRWPEVWQYLAPVWNSLAPQYKFNHQLGTHDIAAPWDDDCAAGSFEGVRAQDILPLLIERFHFHQFAPHANLAEKFFERNYGPNYSADREEDRAIIDAVSTLDEQLIDRGAITPARMLAVLGKRPIENPKFYKDWTPLNVVRDPSAHTHQRGQFKPARLPAGSAPKVVDQMSMTENTFESGFNGQAPKVRSLAFYLPQFHPIAENDEWWGKGFTEWTNVTAARPLYVGHQQPRLPRDLGFYDLRLSEAREAQAEVARAHGIDGFIYYHYWFSGRRVLEQPFEGVLQSGNPDMPFALCWANEDWTRTWDGRSNDILLAQNYSEDDDREHMRHVAQAMRDERYIRIDGKPLFMVHRVALLPNPARSAEIWREEARNAGVGEIFLAYSECMERISVAPQQIGFDASVEFAPDWQATPGTFAETLETHNYLDMASAMLAKPDPGHRRFSGVTPGFDNTPRKGMNGYILTDSQPDLYKGWVASTVMRDFERGNDEVILFVNAWNEWAEGATLEPCSVWGKGYLEAHAAGVAQAISQCSPSPESQIAPASVASVAPVVTKPSQDTERTGITVAIVTNGDPQATMRCLQSAVETCTGLGQIEFVIVDNASTDETHAVLTQLHREVKSVRNETPMPAHVAWMQAHDIATGEHVLFITNDVVLRPNWHEPAIMSLATDPTCVAVTPQMEVNGLVVQSQPLTMTTGVCILSRSEMIPQSLPNEAKIVPESVVSVAAGTTVVA